MVNGHGYCYNNDRSNKQASPGVCCSEPVSVPYVINYSFGTISAWQYMIHNKAGISTCGDFLLHGQLDLGSDSHATLAPSLEVCLSAVILLHATTLVRYTRG